MTAVALGAVLVLAGGVVTVGAVLGMVWEMRNGLDMSAASGMVRDALPVRSRRLLLGIGHRRRD